MRGRVVLLAVAGTTGQLAAQSLQPAVGASVVTTRVRSRLPTGTNQLTGATFGVQGALTVGRVVLGVSYAQGNLRPDGGSAPARTLVEGRVLLGVHPLGWLTLKGGPHARAYVLSAGGTERWLFWELRGRAATAFVGSAVKGYVELWRAIAADANVPEPFDHAQGGEAGMTVRLSRAPVEARVAYRIDRAVLGGGSRAETVEGVVIEVGLARR